MLPFVLFLFMRAGDAPTKNVIDWGCQARLMHDGLGVWREAVVNIRYKDSPDFNQTIWRMPEPPNTPVKQQKKNILEATKECGVWTADFLERRAKETK
jgi:hypothetical protein